MVKRSRGRPKLAEKDRRSEPVGLRLSKPLRKQLEAARHTPDGDRTLTQEIELRLRQSLDLDGEVQKRFGDWGTYYILRLIAECIRQVEKSHLGSPPRKKWFDDQFAFDQVEATISEALGYLKPRGKRAVPKHFPTDLKVDEFPKLIASNVLQAMEVDWDTENNQGIERQSAVGRLAADGLRRRLRRSPLADNQKYFDKILGEFIRKRLEKNK